MMFGSVFRMQAKPGKKPELMRMMTDEPQRVPPGMVAAYAFDTGGAPDR